MLNKTSELASRVTTRSAIRFEVDCVSDSGAFKRRVKKATRVGRLMMWAGAFLAATSLLVTLATLAQAIFGVEYVHLSLPYAPEQAALPRNLWSVMALAGALALGAYAISVGHFLIIDYCPKAENEPASDELIAHIASLADRDEAGVAARVAADAIEARSNSADGSNVTLGELLDMERWHRGAILTMYVDRQERIETASVLHKLRLNFVLWLAVFTPCIFLSLVSTGFVSILFSGVSVLCTLFYRSMNKQLAALALFYKRPINANIVTNLVRSAMLSAKAPSATTAAISALAERLASGGDFTPYEIVSAELNIISQEEAKKKLCSLNPEVILGS